MTWTKEGLEYSKKLHSDWTRLERYDESVPKLKAEVKKLRATIVVKDKWLEESQGLMRSTINEQKIKIQSLEALLKVAREKNVKMSVLLGRVQKLASKQKSVRLKNQNKHLREQFKKLSIRYKELNDKYQAYKICFN